MASKRVEDKHRKAVDRILNATGLVCIRTPTPSTQESVESVDMAEASFSEEEPETSPEVTSYEESPTGLISQTIEEEKSIFPSPSLRKILPDKIRKIEEQNRIHVLPKEFKTNIDPALIPKIVPQIKYIDIIASLVGCTEYKSSLAEFWFLDSMANMLRRAQEDLLPRTSQAVLMLWFCEWMKEIQNFDAADRQRMLRRFKMSDSGLNIYSALRVLYNNAFRMLMRLPRYCSASGMFAEARTESFHAIMRKRVACLQQLQRTVQRPLDNMLSAARFIAEDPRLPTPDEAGVYYRALDEDLIEENLKKDHKSTMVPQPSGDSHLVTFENCAYECAMRDLVTIMHYIFDLTDYQFDLVRSIFTFTPEYHQIDVPYPLLNPKRVFVPLKPKKEKIKKEPKKDAKGKKKEVDTEEYLALMELKAKDEREFEEQEAKDAESWNMRSSILPLGLAGTDELFDKYWPPPPPEPEPEPEVKPEKGKKKR